MACDKCTNPACEYVDHGNGPSDERWVALQRLAADSERLESHMVARCRTPTDAMFPDYGGRGIRVADEWVGRGGFEYKTK